MRWHDFDHNGKINGRDYYLMNELLKAEEDSEKEYPLFTEEDDLEDSDDLW